MLSTLNPVAKEERELIGTLKLGELAVPIYEAQDVARLARESVLLDWRGGDADLVEHIDWMIRKSVLGECITRSSSPVDLTESVLQVKTSSSSPLLDRYLVVSPIPLHQSSTCPSRSCPSTVMSENRS